MGLCQVLTANFPRFILNPMFKDFLKRIIAEAIRELISPQLNDIRST
jgi:hypothetical protein